MVTVKLTGPITLSSARSGTEAGPDVGGPALVAGGDAEPAALPGTPVPVLPPGDVAVPPAGGMAVAPAAGVAAPPAADAAAPPPATVEPASGSPAPTTPTPGSAPLPGVDRLGAS